MKRHELWRAQYRARRYMEFLTKEALEQRGKDIFLNLAERNRLGQFSLPEMNDEGRSWMALWTHVLEEYALRSSGLPTTLADDLPDADFAFAQRAGQIVANYGQKPDSSIVKYGQLRYLEPMVERGIIRVSPASSYDDPSLNGAIRDRELEIAVEVLPSECKLNAVDRKTGKVKGILNPAGNIRVTHRLKTNFYVYCLSQVLAPRLFMDFRSDSCVVIKDQREFLKRINEKFEEAMPGFECIPGPVVYYDPLNANPDNLPPAFSKHLRYAYQRESRVIWFPAKDQEHLDHLLLELGTLSGFCELVRLCPAP